MKMTSILKYVWLAVGICAAILTIFLWFGYDSQNLRLAILTFNALMFVLSLPCSLFFVPVALAANYYLEIEWFSGAEIYLNTIFLLFIGAMQWFWIRRFWSPTEAPFQKLHLIDAEGK